MANKLLSAPLRILSVRAIRPPLLRLEGVQRVRNAAVLQKICRECSQQQSSDRPVQFSGSKAASMSSAKLFLNDNRGNAPWYQAYSIIASLAVFLLYFCALREENNWDEHLQVSIYDKVPGLEEASLIQGIRYKRQRGEDTTELDKALLDCQQRNRQQ